MIAFTNCFRRRRAKSWSDWLQKRLLAGSFEANSLSADRFEYSAMSVTASFLNTKTCRCSH